jgi:multidrug resistance efflux pump
MPGKPNMVALQKSRLELTKALQQLSTETKALESKVRANVDGSTADAIKKTRGVLKKLNSDLVETLDKALNEKTPAKVDAAYKTVVQSFKGLASHVTTDPSLKAVEDNPLGVKVAGVAAVRKALSSLGKALQ